jgi:hypothetical protein
MFLASFAVSFGVAVTIRPGLNVVFENQPVYEGDGPASMSFGEVITGIVQDNMMKAMLDGYIRTSKNSYKSVELAWIGDFNPVMNRMVEKYVCARKHKVHTTYRYLFDREKEFTRCPRVGLKPRPKSEIPQA